ncbi:biotin-dependent carboxyltransferase family protein [Jiella sp. MQZ9-1]|uniref:Biotin-dependent carboxyltransferase n=1 Tax=Jiella flava TaxID=2816857 RepID=A0A939FWP0_9HYPH|nr:biotin-dependent carboxyltransferase family protein [Jiella flava]MBO0661423.1 biotin-dependent carboxyltransferase [Jiella flava]MCD2470066.1 biotin-dependent carboxyltransferase family protein [Jiella flava]
MIKILKAGLETSVQDYPGRIGYWNQGFPPSGPMDSWSFRMANVLVGNAPGAAGFECQFLGPTLQFGEDTVIAITGADMTPAVDGEAVPLWQSLAVKAGQTLVLSGARVGARAYIAFAGGLANPEMLGSRSTFNKAGVGGIDGHSVKPGQELPLFQGDGTPGLKVPDNLRPQIRTDKTWDIEVCAGPNDDWIDEAGHERFLTSPWTLSAKSDRTGFRLEGPEWTFTQKATNKPREHGSLPSNIIDHGYPMGAINLAGQTPIILVNDGPSMGGFINPYTVPSCAFWKLGQSKPNETFKFKLVSVSEAQDLALQIAKRCVAENLVKA